MCECGEVKEATLATLPAATNQVFISSQSTYFGPQGTKFSFHNILKYFLFHSDFESHKSSFLSLQSTFRWASHFDFKVFILTKFFSYLIIPTAWLTKYTMVAIRIEGTKNKLGMTKKHCFFFSLETSS